jgi:hypothetical protein
MLTNRRYGKVGRIVGKARRQQADHGRREQERDREQHRLGGEQQGEDAIRKDARRVRPAALTDARIGGHEGGVERPLGENGAEMVGQAQGDEEGIGDRAGAEDRRQHDVAQEAGDARDQGQAADREDAFEHVPSFFPPGRRSCPDSKARIRACGTIERIWQSDGSFLLA